MKTLTTLATLCLFLLALTLPAFGAMTQGMPDNAKQQLAKGNIKLESDTLKIKLYSNASTTMTIGTATTCSTVGELANGVNGVAGYAPAPVTGAAVTLDTTNHYAILSFTSPSWSNFTGTFDAFALCDYTAPNDTSNGTLVGYWIINNTSATNGPVVLNVPAATYSTGIMTWH